ncbi:hypothetical protein F5J12DRAFT_786577 [Pisolithus orientalis]|uniref:uncharacterized protein n=1 Tax=Pisolithus orientalis TaxID=936130 RepID=UPI002224AC67|nr:uncharacterized protein F5J12DRAFT_786577 [Pisolithus orientalis]KAI5990051.1 hypothetical protein F5J12DRAFT_786577 [Pisolithus orientalis]
MGQARGAGTNLDRELDEVRRVMATPAPDASPAELHQPLGQAQVSFNRLREELIKMRNELNEFKAKVAPRAQSQALKLIAQGPLDAAIVTLAKKYAYFYHLWVPSAPESKAIANGAELYLMVPPELQAQTMKYEHFEQLIIHIYGEWTGSWWHSVTGERELDNPAFCHSSSETQRNHDEAYTPLAPILFEDPSAMNVSGLFKNKALTQIACVLHFGKGVLTGKKKGGPPGRGQKLKATTMPEGIITICCTFARFLLSGDDEFSSTGSQTGISYEKDFEFYIELLQKQENKKWALGIFEHFDNAIFGANQRDGSQQPPPEAEDSVEAPRSWEDDILAQLGGVSRTAEVNSNPPTVPITSQSATHPSILTSTIQAEDFPPQIHTNSLGATSTAWGNGTSISGAIQPNTNLSSQPSVSTHLNPLDPLVVVPALATKKGKKATQGQAKAMEEGIGAVPARVTCITRQKK